MSSRPGKMLEATLSHRVVETYSTDAGSVVSQTATDRRHELLSDSRRNANAPVPTDETITQQTRT